MDKYLSVLVVCLVVEEAPSFERARQQVGNELECSV